MENYLKPNLYQIGIKPSPNTILQLIHAPALKKEGAGESINQLPRPTRRQNREKVQLTNAIKECLNLSLSTGLEYCTQKPRGFAFS